MTSPSPPEDAAVVDAILSPAPDLARRAYLPDGSIEVFDESGQLVERIPSLDDAPMEPRGSMGSTPPAV